MEVMASLLVSLFYTLISRAGPQDQTPGPLVQGHNKDMLPCCKAPGCHGAPMVGSAPTFLSLIAVNPNVALRADAEEGGLINPGQAGAPILTVVHVAEVTWKQSHMSLQAIPKADIDQSPMDAQGAIPSGTAPLWMLQGGQQAPGRGWWDPLPDPAHDCQHSTAMAEIRSMRSALPWHIKKRV